MSTTTWRLCVKKPKPGATTGFDAMTEYLLVCPECLAEAHAGGDRSFHECLGHGTPSV